MDRDLPEAATGGIDVISQDSGNITVMEVVDSSPSHQQLSAGHALDSSEVFMKKVIVNMNSSYNLDIRGSSQVRTYVPCILFFRLLGCVVQKQHCCH